MAVERKSADGGAIATVRASPAAAAQRAYDLPGCAVSILSGDCAVAGFLDPILAPLTCEPPAVPDWTICLVDHDTTEMPESGARIFDGTLPEGLPAFIVDHDRVRSLVVPGHFAIKVDRIAKRAEHRYIKGKTAAMGGTAAFWMLGEILAANAQYLLHGAAAVDPRYGEVVALFAPSGTGKTTTVLALARSGFHFASDDAMVMSVREQTPTIWGVPRQAKISRQTAAMLPWLAPCLTQTWIDGEQAVARDALAPLVMLASPQPRRVRQVIVLRPPNERDHVLLPVTKPDALATIARDNVRVAPGGVGTDNAAAFAALSTLIATTPVTALSPGPDPSTLATRMFGL
jgi:hypothetical protein